MTSSEDFVHDRFVQVMSLPVPGRLLLYVTIYPFSFSKNTILFQSIKGILRKLYHYNHRVEYWDLNSRPKPIQTGSTALSGLNNDPGASDSTQSRSESIHNWGGPLTRRALQAIYTIAFICLLRSDEVLKIRRDHVEFVKEDDNSEYMVLTLPFRKTHQDGRTFSRHFLELFLMLITMADVQPFYIYPLDEEEAHLCPVRAMGEWIKASEVTSGFLFRRFMSQDRPSAHEDTAMVSFFKLL
jgi:hypothetical protein